MIIGIDNIKEWNNKYLELSHKNRDIHYKWEFLKIFSQHENAKPILFIFQSEEGMVYYPFLKRRIERTDYYDITSQYGYGGPLYKIKGDRKLLLLNFRKEFNEYCLKNNIVSEFIRFHPMIKNHEGLEFDIECINTSKIIYIDLTKTEDEIFRNYKYNNRKSINKAKRGMVEILVDNDNIKEFQRIYKSTMKRNQALDYYNFEKEFFYFFKEQLNENCFYYFAKKDEVIISTELVLLSKEYGHSYLGGTDSNYFNLCPNNLLKHGIILELKRRGMKYFILGGGYKKEDGIYNYKKSFNENGVLDFYIGKKIHNLKIYEELNKNLEKKNPNIIGENEGYFPLYRRK